MSSGERLPWKDAARLAREIVEIIRPSTERLILAGSLRRKAETVGDLELVVIPRMERSVTHDLFASEWTVTSAVETTMDALLAEGVFTPRLDKNGRMSLGPQLKKVWYGSFGLDLCVTDAETWGALVTIRTGPWEFSKGLVTPKSKGGLLPEYLEFKDGFHLHHKRTHERFPTPEEADVFRLLDLGWIEPQDRCWPLPRHLQMGAIPTPEATETEPATLEGRWARFDRENPHVYEILERMAAEDIARAQSQGQTRIGIRTLWERMRTELRVRTQGDPNWGLNNNYTALYVRKLIARNPAWESYFELRGKRERVAA